MTTHPDRTAPLPARVQEMLKELDVGTTGSTPDGWPYDPIALAEAIADYHTSYAQRIAAAFALPILHEDDFPSNFQE